MPDETAALTGVIPAEPGRHGKPRPWRDRLRRTLADDDT